MSVDELNAERERLAEELAGKEGPEDFFERAAEIAKCRADSTNPTAQMLAEADEALQKMRPCPK